MMGALREGVLVGSGAVGCLPYPSHLSAPVTLTLTLSRRAGEGNPRFAAAMVSGFRRNDAMVVERRLV